MPAECAGADEAVRRQQDIEQGQADSPLREPREAEQHQRSAV
jgi:hypothetical protein